MKKSLQIISCLLLFSLLFSGCKSSSNSKSDKTIADIKSTYHYFTFPKTDWGMKKDDVFLKWDLKEEDFTVEENSNYYEFRKDEVYTANKTIKVAGLDANVSFTFSSLDDEKNKMDIGLTKVVAEFKKDDFNDISSRCKETFGESYSQGNLFPSEGRLNDLPEKQLNQALNIYQDYLTPEDIEWKKNPDIGEANALSMFELKQLTTEPYSIQLIYQGNDIAIVNAVDQ